MLTKHDVFTELHEKFWLSEWLTDGFLASTEYLDYASARIRSRTWIRHILEDHTLEELREACPSIFRWMSQTRLRSEELARDTVASHLEHWLRPGTRRGNWVDQNVDGKALRFFNDGLLLRARKAGVVFKKDDGTDVRAKNLYLNRGGPIRTFYLEHKISGGFEVLHTGDIGRVVELFRSAIAEQEK